MLFVLKGSTADALTLLDALEAKLGEYPGQFSSLHACSSLQEEWPKGCPVSEWWSILMFLDLRVALRLALIVRPDCPCSCWACKVLANRQVLEEARCEGLSLLLVQSHYRQLTENRALRVLVLDFETLDLPVFEELTWCEASRGSQFHLKCLGIVPSGRQTEVIDDHWSWRRCRTSRWDNG